VSPKKKKKDKDDAAKAPEASGGAEDGAEEQELEGVPGEPGEAAPEPSEAEAAEAPAESESEDAEAEAEPEATEQPAAEAAEPDEEAQAEEDAPPAERPRSRRGGGDQDGSEEDLIPGAHLEPDLVLEEEQRPQSEYGEYGEADVAAVDAELGEEEPVTEAEGAEPEPVVHQPLDLAADARYAATGKRKSAVARVILRPGEGTYTINSRHLDEYFPRVRLQRMARQPLEAAGYQNRMDVAARIHGGGVSAQATALRHGVARALVEADPALRGELKRRGYLTRDPRVKERKKAGLKKARKRPQFSKR
jgi:small subunit ribosomal protein S9